VSPTPLLDAGTVEVRTVGTESEGSNYAFVAAGQMILFMFVNSLTAGAGFIEMRRKGILGRVTAGPVDAGDMLFGLGVSRFAIATALAAVISIMAALAYGVDWGNLSVLVAVIVVFGVVSAAASALIGAALDEPDASVSVGIPIGIGMAALGGCMFPLFLAPEGVQIAAKVFTPHAWALDAILSSAYDGAGLADVWVNFVVLAAWAVVLLGIAWVLAGRSVRRGSRGA
jgi:ABC-2 type transport system permease protein